MIVIMNRQNHHAEKGFASIVVALILLLVLSLLTVGFAELARHEQQNSLSKHLSSQAYYAAEAGINDAKADILSGKINDTNASNTLCMTKTGSLRGTHSLDPTALSSDPVIDSTNDVAYTCLFVTLNPPQLQWDSVSPFSSRTSMFTMAGGSWLDSFTISWGSSDHQTTMRDHLSDKFPNQSDWRAAGAPPVLQVSFTPYGQTVKVDHDNLYKNTFSLYLYPSKDTSDSNAIDYTNGTTDGAPIVSGKCSTDPTKVYPCSVTIKSIFGKVLGADHNLVRITSLYDSANVVIGNAKDTSNNPLQFKDGQAIIDVTGKARNVVKRVRVAEPLTGTPDLPTDVLEAQSICKRIGVYPGALNVDTPSEYAGSSVCDPAY